MRTTILAAALVLLRAGAGLAQPHPPISIVAAENFYADVARQVAGPDIAVTSILSNPDEDPHLFEASPSVARALSGATVAIYNGADYDPWMEKLLQAARSPGRQVIVAGALLRSVPGANPHLWWGPDAVPAVARALAADLSQADPAHAGDYAQRLGGFLASLRPVQARVVAMRQRYAGQPITATEPVFGLMATTLGLSMRNERFQLAVMNSTEPAASDIAAFEDDLRQHRVRLLIYNSQASDPAAARLLQIARDAHVPVVGVTETEPAGTTYQDWMLSSLDAVEHALAHPGS